MAPANAAIRMAIYPERLNMLEEILPPIINITNATPNPAPLFIPNIDGPARGFLNAV